jgi:hypothetical protein
MHCIHNYWKVFANFVKQVVWNLVVSFLFHILHTFFFLSQDLIAPLFVLGLLSQVLFASISSVKLLHCFTFCAKKVSIFLHFKDFFSLPLKALCLKGFMFQSIGFIFHLSFLIEVFLGFVIHYKNYEIHNHI